MSAPVQISLLNIADVTDAQMSELLPLLGAGERARHARFGANGRRRQFLAGRLLLRWSLVRLLDLTIDSIAIEERAQQAPLLHVSGEVHSPYFSISHSGDWIACALSRHAEIGLDIELVNDQRDLARLAEHSFSEADLLWWQQQSNPVVAFYRLWSIREAHFKLTQSYGNDLAHYPETHCAAIDHPQLSMALLSAAVLTAAPVCVPSAWTTLVDMID